MCNLLHNLHAQWQWLHVQSRELRTLRSSTVFIVAKLHNYNCALYICMQKLSALLHSHFCDLTHTAACLFSEPWHKKFWTVSSEGWRLLFAKRTDCTSTCCYTVYLPDDLKGQVRGGEKFILRAYSDSDLSSTRGLISVKHSDGLVIASCVPKEQIMSISKWLSICYSMCSVLGGYSPHWQRDVLGDLLDHFHLCLLMYALSHSRALFELFTCYL